MSCPVSQNHFFWWLWSECSPLPIPNREVKPHIADDTALVCGKVGRRQSFLRAFHLGCSFFVLLPASRTRSCKSYRNPHEAKRRSKKNGNMFRWPKTKCHKNHITVMIRTYCHMGSLLTSFCKNPRQPYSSNNPQVNANKHNIPIYSLFSLSRYMLFPYAIMPKPWQ